MKIRNFLAASLMIGALAMPAAAQDDAHDPKAKEVLDKVTATTKGYASLRASFDWTLENKAEKTKDTKSGFMFLKGEKYKMMLAGMEMFSDGATMWTYSKDDNEITISEIDDSDESIVSNPAKIFSLYEKGFKYALKGEAQVNAKARVADGKTATSAKQCYIIDLYPESPKGKEFHTIELAVEKSTSHILSIDIKFKNGSDQIIEITEYKPNASMPDALFTYDPAKYPGAEVNDMR